MPTLNPVTQSPMHTGPTFDPAAEKARPLYRQEPFQIQASGPIKVEIASRPRPMTHRVSHDIVAGRTQVSARQGNANPAAVGGTDVSSIWAVSDPHQLSFLADEESGTSMGMLKTVGLGLALGWVALKVLRG